jgi:hypothetical protein
MMTIRIPATPHARASRAKPAMFALIVLALAAVCIHTLLNGNYGFHRDELAALDDARTLAWGYIAYPPLTPAIGHLALFLFGTSLAGLRFFAALAYGISILLTGLMAREFGASRQGQLLAATAVALAPATLLGGSLFQYVAFDYLAWVAIAWCLLRLLNSENPRWWLAIGTLIGLGMLTKYTVLFWTAGLGVGVLLTPARRYLASPWLWLGVAASLLLFLPNAIWQWQHDFISLDFLQHIHARDVANGRTDGFAIRQFQIGASPVAAPLWLAGLYFLLIDAQGRRYRLLGWMYLATFGLLLLARGRGYYLAPAYPMLLAAGSMMWLRWLQRVSAVAARWVQTLSWTILLVCGIALGTLLVPIAPLHSRLWEISAKVHDNFREQIGWHNIVATVATVYAGLPEQDKANTRILTGNYGEAGALDLYHDAYPLPPVISAVNSYWYKGYGEPPPDTVIVLGYDRDDLAQLFADCRLAAQVVNRAKVVNEESRDHPDIFVCRQPREPWSVLWPHMRHYG